MLKLMFYAFYLAMRLLKKAPKKNLALAWTMPVLDQAIEASGRDNDWTTLAVPGQRTGDMTSRLPDVAILPFSTIENVLDD